MIELTNLQSELFNTHNGGRSSLQTLTPGTQHLGKDLKLANTFFAQKAITTYSFSSGLHP